MWFQNLFASLCRRGLVIVSILLVASFCYGQSAGPALSDKDIQRTQEELATLQDNIAKQTQGLLARTEKIEQRLQQRLQATDSVKASELFGGVTEKYQQLRNAIQSPGAIPVIGMAQRLKVYIPRIDSLQTSLHFLQQKDLGFSADKIVKLQALSSGLEQVQEKLLVSGQVQSYLADRAAILSQELARFNLSNKLTAINQEAYYYQQKIAQYKEAFSNKEKLKETLINLAAAQPAFQKFWQKNSILSTMFPNPGEGDTATEKSLANLQTRAQVNKLIAERSNQPIAATGKTDGGGSGYLAQQIQQAKSQMDAVKNKIRQLGLSGNSNDIVMPNFTPNNQRTKPFLKRIEWGFNMQNAPSTNYIPATTNIAVLLGYKFSDQVTVGVGLAYLLGWGRPVSDIHFSSQGIGLRGYADIKVKGSWWASGGFEYNYMNAFSSIPNLHDPDIWQKSALLGVTKKYRLGNKNANLQLLYDLLASQQIPASSPIKFRVGYSF
jgi:hypothetical protein